MTLSERIMTVVRQNKASDLFIDAGELIQYKSMGEMHVECAHQPLTECEIRELFGTKIPVDEIRQKDFSFEIHDERGKGRFRGKYFSHLNGWRVNLRPIAAAMPPPLDLNIPEVVLKRFLGMKSGIVFVAGRAGQGKSTTMASLVQERINREPCHLITLEDPIEYVFHGVPHQGRAGAVITQKEKGLHFESFSDGLVHAVRESPDILLLGELRDVDTIETAVSAAESGHIVITSFHAGSIELTFQRILGRFAKEQINSIAESIAWSTEMVIHQRLVQTEEPKQRWPIFEVLNVRQENGVPYSSIWSAIKGMNWASVRREIDNGVKNGSINEKRWHKELALRGYVPPVSGVEEAVPAMVE